MALAERKARTLWKGTLTDGQGELTLMSSNVIEGVTVTWASRTEDPGGRTSPEELLAGAQAACYAMALSSALTKQGNPPDGLDVTATCSLDRADNGVRVSRMVLEVEGRVPGLDQAGFEDAARRAEQGCPISNAIRGNVEISVTARLAT